VGIDIVEIARVERLARRSRRFLSRVFTKEEVRYCAGKRRKWQHFAVRFAAKEAIWKALGSPGLALKSISIRSARDGRPEVLLDGKLARGVQVSLSHCERYAAAAALASKP